MTMQDKQKVGDGLGYNGEKNYISITENKKAKK